MRHVVVLPDPPRPPLLPTIVLLLLAIVSVGATVASVWGGRQSRDLTLEEARAIAVDYNQSPARRKMAAASLRRHARDAVDTLLRICDQPGEDGETARAAIEHLRASLR